MKKLILPLILLTFSVSIAQKNEIKNVKNTQILKFINNNALQSKAISNPLAKTLLDQLKEYHKTVKTQHTILAVPLKKEYLDQLKKYHGIK